MKIKTNELIGPALNWAVMTAEGPDSFAANFYYDGDTPVCIDDQAEFPETWNPGEDWAQGGPIIESEGMQIQTFMDKWLASIPRPFVQQDGPTPLIAAMRCYVASKLGDEVEVPEELV
jgi:hypothetical protein